MTQHEARTGDKTMHGESENARPNGVKTLLEVDVSAAAGPGADVQKVTITAPEAERQDGEPRFFLDHGVVHDRKTGKHVRGCGCFAGEGSADDLLALLSELEVGGSMRLHFSREWLRQKIATDPDDEPEATPAERPALVGGEDVLRIGVKRHHIEELASTMRLTAHMGPTPECIRSWADELQHMIDTAALSLPAAQDGDGVRVASPEEEAEIDAAAGLAKIVTRVPVDLSERLRREASAAGLAFPAYIRQLLATPNAIRGDKGAEAVAELDSAKRLIAALLRQSVFDGGGYCVSLYAMLPAHFVKWARDLGATPEAAPTQAAAKDTP